MENQILLGLLKSQLQIHETTVKRCAVYPPKQVPELVQDAIISLKAQIKELEAMPEIKPVYEIKPSNYVEGNYYVFEKLTGHVVMGIPLSLKDAELLCKLANNQKP